MALNKLKFNSLNVTPTAGKTIGFNSSANGLEATLSGGDMRFIKKLTASSSSTLSFVDGSSDVVLDSTYKEYIFMFKDIHAGTDSGQFGFKGSTNSGSSYGITKTTTFFNGLHFENDSTARLGYETGRDLAQSTGLQVMTVNQSDDADSGASGFLHIFNPSSTTFVKHFISRVSSMNTGSNYGALDNFMAGYFNTTSAIDAIQFAMDTGNIDAGTITLYGIN